MNTLKLVGSFDVILYDEVFEHLSHSIETLDEPSGLLKLRGKLVFTVLGAPFVPHHYTIGFIRYWYEFHLAIHKFKRQQLRANGDCFLIAKQKILRLPFMVRQYNSWCWPLPYLASGLHLLYFCCVDRERKSMIQAV